MIIKIMTYAAIVVAIFAAVLFSGLAFRAYCQSKNAAAIRLASAASIDEGMFVSVGGIEQWVQIRGEDRNNPVVLVLHGGPGFSYVPFTPSFRSWEHSFTVVQWDQRGTGKTFGRNGKTGSGEMSIDRMVRDAIEVAEFLTEHLHKRKVILFAHSWGTILGVPMAIKRPDLFSAYVGSGQIVRHFEGVDYSALRRRDEDEMIDGRCAGPR